MKYVSTKGSINPVSFREAVMQGLASNGGLFVPAHPVKMPGNFLKEFRGLTKIDLAVQVIQPFVGNDLSKDELKSICEWAWDFDCPLVQVEQDVYCLELFHGESNAFKDFGARFLSQCVQHFSKDIQKKKVLLTATSGDTGGAVAASFANVKDVDVVILYPSKRVSKVQELQLITGGKNIHAVEVDGDFDRCQQLVKESLGDCELQKVYHFLSANSINVARWISQQAYYWFALQQWREQTRPIISVPSGNLGNVTAGLLAQQAGLPIEGFIVACNSNDSVTRYFSNGHFDPLPTIQTLSNAMDVGNPNNFPRLNQLMKESVLKEGITSRSISDLDTMNAIREVGKQCDYHLEPHGAVAYSALKHYLDQNVEAKGFFLGTAHPVKFMEIVSPLVDRPIEVPSSIKDLHLKKQEKVYLEKNTPLQPLLMQLI